VAYIEGIPAGLPLVMERDVDPELARRQQGYGRGRRMQIESDRAEVLSGVRLGETLGSPIAMLVWNRDWENWQTAMSPLPPEPDHNPKALRPLYLPRPGHADLVGVLKYDRRDARDILERASARETAARVACGAVARRLLDEFGIEIGSHVLSIGDVVASPAESLPADLNAVADASPLRTLDAEADALMIEAIDRAKGEGDTLGGVFEVVVTGVPVGLGSHVSWDRKLDGRLAGAVMSVQAVKGVEIGMGFAGAGSPGSGVHDPIIPAPNRERLGGIGRASNRAGGLEGGVTTGEPLVIRGAMKPISTLRKRLPSVDLRDGGVDDAAVERSDVCAVPAAAVVAEAMVALVVVDAFLDKFGGDSLGGALGEDRSVGSFSWVSWAAARAPWGPDWPRSSGGSSWTSTKRWSGRRVSRCPRSSVGAAKPTSATESTKRRSTPCSETAMSWPRVGGGPPFPVEWSPWLRQPPASFSTWAWTHWWRVWSVTIPRVPCCPRRTAGRRSGNFSNGDDPFIVWPG
jgi:chorismate synthase